MNLLVAIDGSELSFKAADVAIGLAKNCPGKITLISVVYQEPAYNAENMPAHLLQHILSAHEDLLEKEKERSQMILNFVAKKFEQENIKTDTIVSVGFPSEEIVKTADNGNYDMIIIGCKGLTSLTRKMFIGSVTERVIYYSNCNILVVK